MFSPKQLFAGAVAAAFFVLPAYAFDFGRPASSDEIKLWDIDVRPDGKGLPDGSGTAGHGKEVFAEIGFGRPGRSGVAHGRDVEAEFHSDARRRLNACVGEQAHADDLFLAVALELVLEIGVRKAARRPVFSDDDVALLNLKVIVKGAAPCAFRKRLTLAGAELVGRRILPVHVIARFPAVMGHVIDLDAGLAGCAHNGAQVVEKIDLLRHVLDPGPELAAFAQEIVVEIDAEAVVSSTADAGIPSRIPIEFGKEQRLWGAHRTSRRRKTGRGS
jgi:hypothetical protein